MNGSFVSASNYRGPRLGGFPLTGMREGHLGYTRGFVPRFVSLDSRVSDAALRESNVTGPLLHGLAARSEGWSSLETIEKGFRCAPAAELRESELREEPDVSLVSSLTRHSERIFEARKSKSWVIVEIAVTRCLMNMGRKSGMARNHEADGTTDSESTLVRGSRLRRYSHST